MNSIFYQYMNEVYGADRWPKLFEALRGEDKKVAWVNPYGDFKGETQNLLGQKYLEVSSRLPDQQNFYLLDLASLLPPIVLNPGSEDVCLDMCAAPGGKSLILTSLIAKDLSTRFDLTVNEISGDRRTRLIRVLKEQLPEEIFRQIKITKHDASKWCLYQKEFFDKILLDAPCSGERFFINSEKEIASWTKKSSQNMSARQFGLVASAFECLKVGGHLVYSTCSLSPYENDEVIRKLLKKRPARVEVLKFASPIGEETEFGWKILPDQTGGYGPIYFAHVKKI